MTEYQVANLVSVLITVAGMLFCLVAGYYMGRMDEARERKRNE